MKNLLFIVIALLLKMFSYSQDAKEEAIAALKKMGDQYRNSGYLSFDVKYRYASEEEPEKYLDSLEGNFKLNGSNFWYMLDNTSAMYNGQYAVAVYPQDNIIYLSKP